MPKRTIAPFADLPPILKAFEDEGDEWDIAIWFASAKSFLGGAAPKDLLARDPERVLAAAADELTGVMHG